MDKAYDIPLHDIKPIVEIQEYSLYYFIGLVGLASLFAVFVIYFMYKWYKKTKRFNIRKQHKELMLSIEFDNPKNAAYMITSYAITFKDDTPQINEEFYKLTQKLQEYKYKKDVKKFDSETVELINSYRSMLNV